MGGIVATVQDPDSFDNFRDSSGNFQMAVPFFQTTGEGLFCFPVNLATSGVSGLSDGINATIQIVFDGGDDKLYQVCFLYLTLHPMLSNLSISPSVPMSS